uniref:Uncharacterized protein n=1 Tax=Oryza glumipatula TaxID=40148 RepID=A0A0D9ZII0_9ORYZ
MNPPQRRSGYSCAAWACVERAEVTTFPVDITPPAQLSRRPLPMPILHAISPLRRMQQQH